jgi:flavin-dependent dehydrogenase
MRRRVARQRNVTLRGGCRALEIVGTSDGMQVTGVRCETLDGVQDTIAADVVIDASRPGTLTLSFLGSSGQRPEETTIGVDIRYATGLFALSHGALREFKAVVTFPKAPEGVHYGYLVPVEGNRFQLPLVGRGDDAPPVGHSGVCWPPAWR